MITYYLTNNICSVPIGYSVSYPTGLIEYFTRYPGGQHWDSAYVMSYTDSPSLYIKTGQN